ncbi:type IVB secretion system apparatus protein IcmL/DotI [Thiotrichales bacterium 19S11-10]|nr:type IVB secretion system apparatus protein IcmL/DotI [Thiotrichales bacterium 19S11-10]
MSDDVLTQIIKRNDFYKNNFRRLVTILLISCLLNVGLFVGLVLSFNAKPDNRYFAVTNQGKLIQLESRSSAYITNDTVISWVSDVVPKLYALDFLNYRSQLNELNKYFTTHGWNSYSTAFKPALERLVSGQLVTRATLQNVPVISAKGTMNGSMAWKIQVPVMINYQKGSKGQNSQIVLSLTVVQKKNAADGEALGISQIVEKVQ